MLSMLAPHPFDLLDAAMTEAMHARPMRIPSVITRLDSAQPRLHDDGASYKIDIAAAGVAPADLDITARDSRLHIKGETRTAANTHFCNFSVALPDDADVDDATATSVDGLISICLPKKASAEPVRIPVSTTAAMEDESDDETGDERPYQMTLVAAGLAPSDLVIEASKNVLTATGETKRTGAKLARRFRLPRDADTARTTASCVDGILTITVPKVPEAAPKTLMVNAGDRAQEKQEEEVAPPQGMEPAPTSEAMMADAAPAEEDAVVV